jgi:hypothetical protein
MASSSLLGGSCEGACKPMRECTATEKQAAGSLAQVKARCFDNILTRCTQGGGTSDGQWCVGVGKDKTCEARAHSICRCDPKTHPRCQGNWGASVPESGPIRRARLPFPGLSVSSCGASIDETLAVSARRVLRLLASPAALAALLLGETQ